MLNALKILVKLTLAFAQNQLCFDRKSGWVIKLHCRMSHCLVLKERITNVSWFFIWETGLRNQNYNFFLKYIARFQNKIQYLTFMFIFNKMKSFISVHNYQEILNELILLQKIISLDESHSHDSGTPLNILKYSTSL